jgi:hypothetical protein
MNYEIAVYVLERVAIATAALQVGVVLAVSIIIVLYYARHRNMGHIALVSLSYIILTTLVSGAVLYQIFYDGWSRVVAIIASLVAFTLGDVALWKVWHSRRDVREAREMREVQEKLERAMTRLEQIEKELRAEHVVKLDLSEPLKVQMQEPAEVKLIEGDGVDITGRRFDRLLVVGRYPKTDGRNQFWLVRCDCGRERPMRYHSITRQWINSRSCGCVKADTRRKDRRQHERRTDP